MKKTRNVFVLKGKDTVVKAALDKLQFKGLTVLEDAVDVNDNVFGDIFANNKSVLCTKASPTFENQSINISISNKSNEIENYIYRHLEYIDARKDIVSQFQEIAERHNCDIGDHKSNSSGLDGKPSIKDCAYCNYLYNKKSEYTQRTLYRSSNFFIMPTIGQFIKGYLLIIPCKHIMSNAELDDSMRKEFISVLDDAIYMLELTYGISHVLVWENGTGNSGIGKAKDSVVHAHTHVAPSNMDANSISLMSGISMEDILFSELPKFNRHSYLLIRNDDDCRWKISCDPNVYIPRQYVRQCLAEEYNIPGTQWNWRIYPYEDLLMQTYHDISSTLRNNWNKLPDRIRVNTKDYV